MKRYKVEIRGISPYSQGRYHDEPTLEKEGKDDYERRTWRGRMHVGQSGRVVVPPMALKNCLSEAAKFLSLQIPGKGKATYTKHFEAGVLIVEGFEIDVKAADVPGEELFVPADGVRGSGKRVKRIFPRIDEWAGAFEIIVADETITKSVLARHLKEAGSLIGIGRFRPRNNGYYGRFVVESLEEVA